MHAYAFVKPPGSTTSFGLAVVLLCGGHHRLQRVPAFAEAATKDILDYGAASPRRILANYPALLDSYCDWLAQLPGEPAFSLV